MESMSRLSLFHLPQSSSASRFTASASGFLNLSQSFDLPLIDRVKALRDDAFEAPLAGVTEDDVTGVRKVFVEAHSGRT
jgi:hypothetical protein